MFTIPYYLPAGLSPVDIEKQIPAIRYQLNAAHIEMEVRGKAVLLNVWKEDLPKKNKFDSQDLSKYKLGLIIGESFKGLVVLDLSDSHPYLVIGGMPGTGKSNFITQGLQHITDNYTPEQVKFWLVDLKYGVELGPWEQSEYTERFVFETKHLQPLVDKLKKEIRDRMKLFRSLGVYKIDEYNKIPGVEKLPYHLLVIDEYAEARRKKEFEEELQSVLQVGRAAGIRAILATQRPSADNINTSIRGLIADRLCFQVADRTNSEIILDRGGAELLPDVQGRCILLTGAKYTECQVQKARA